MASSVFFIMSVFKIFVGLYYNLSGLGTRFDIGWYVFCSFTFHIHFSSSKL